MISHHLPMVSCGLGVHDYASCGSHRLDLLQLDLRQPRALPLSLVEGSLEPLPDVILGWFHQVPQDSQPEPAQLQWPDTVESSPRVTRARARRPLCSECNRSEYDRVPDRFRQEAYRIESPAKRDYAFPAHKTVGRLVADHPAE